MKKILASILFMAIIFSALVSCGAPSFRFESESEDEMLGEGGCNVTRGEWIEELSNVFGMTDYVNATPYFLDVSSSDSIFPFVQSCYEWEVLRNVKNRFNKDFDATYEFVVTTAVYAIDADLSKYTVDDDVEKAFLYAQENNLIESNIGRDTSVTIEQCNSLLEKSQELYLNIAIAPIDKVVMKENVSDKRDTNSVDKISENQYSIAGDVPSVGGIYIVPGDLENPNGIAVKVVEIVSTNDGKSIVNTTVPELHEVFEEIEYSGFVAPELEDVIPAEGVTIKGLGSDDVTPVSGLTHGGKIVNLSCKNTARQKPTISPLGMGGSKEDALSFVANCNFTKGTVGVSAAWSNASVAMNSLLTGDKAGTASPNLGEWFEKKSVFPDKTLFGPDVYSNEQAIKDYENGKINLEELKKELSKYQKEDGTEKIPNMTNKFSGGYSITGSLSISDLYVVPTYELKKLKVFGVETDIPIGIKKVSIETNYSISGSLSLQGSIENELKVCTIPVPLGGTAALNIDISLYVELNGEVSVKASISNNTKIEYNSGNTKKTCKKDASLSAEAEVELEAGPKIDVRLSFLGVDIISGGVSAGINIKGNIGASLNTEHTETEESIIIERKTVMEYGVVGTVPIVKATLGGKSTLADKLGINFSWTIVGAEGSNAPLKAFQFNILPPQEKVLWSDKKVLEKQKEESENSKESETNSSENDLGQGILSISKYRLNLSKGDSATIELLAMPAGYKESDIYWYSENETIAKATRNGLKCTVTAIGSGNTMIIAATSDGLYAMKCAIYVASDDTVSFKPLD